ncbi:MAG: galactose mutarotase [Tannerella sp.]|jgi:aldose 1-epimerase|nr:galactose mutarotase [Tannerella sp.]
MNSLKESDFLKGIPGNTARLVTLKNPNGLVAQFTNYGARWVNMWVPDQHGEFDDILLGFDTLTGYMNAGEQYHGAIVGRVCGRINQARFSLCGKEYKLDSNDVYGDPVKNHLHGGIKAFHKQLWDISNENENTVTFSLFSPDGDESYPGNLTVHVTYKLTPENSLRMECTATTDQPSPVNLTNHAFFNLQKNKQHKSVLSHFLKLRSTSIVACDKELIPTGTLKDISNTFLNFTSPKTIAASISAGDDMVKKDKGFSVAFVLSDKDTDLDWAATLEDTESGRSVEIYTNQPSLQVYTGYFMDGSDIGRENAKYFAGAGIALEPQGYPDAPNQPQSLSIIIDKNNPYRHITEYRFN